MFHISDFCMDHPKQEADAESKYLSGVGVARQRKAIVDGLRESVVMFSESVEDTTSKDVMDLLLLTQYFGKLELVACLGLTVIDCMFFVLQTHSRMWATTPTLATFSCQAAQGRLTNCEMPSRSEEHTSELQSIMTISYTVL